MLSVIVLNIIALTGCTGLPDINDVYSMASTDKYEEEGLTQPQWTDNMAYRKLPSGKELPAILEADSKMKVSMGNNNEPLQVEVEEAVMTDNYNDAEQYMSKESAENIYKSINESSPGLIRENGTFGTGRYGVKEKALIIRYVIYNPANADITFSPALPLYDVTYDDKGNVNYYKVEDPVIRIDKPDGWTEHFFSKVTIKAGEIKEITAVVLVDSKRVIRYKSHRENNKTIIDEVETDEKLLDNAYIGSGEISKNDGPGIWTNRNLMKLNIKNNG